MTTKIYFIQQLVFGDFFIKISNSNCPYTILPVENVGIIEISLLMTVRCYLPCVSLL